MEPPSLDPALTSGGSTGVASEDAVIKDGVPENQPVIESTTRPETHNTESSEAPVDVIYKVNWFDESGNWQGTFESDAPFKDLRPVSQTRRNPTSEGKEHLPVLEVVTGIYGQKKADTAPYKTKKIYDRNEVHC